MCVKYDAVRRALRLLLHCEKVVVMLFRVNPSPLVAGLLLFSIIVAAAGCNSASNEGAEATTAVADKAAAGDSAKVPSEAGASAKLPDDLEPTALPPSGFTATELLSAALPIDQLEQGWVRLFDGKSFSGWFIFGSANWQIADNAIKVNRGEGASFLCSSFMLDDYELKLEFRANRDTNSGVFLRTTPEPLDVAVDCIELNIAPTDNPFPTGSLVKRQRVEPETLGEFDSLQWHTYRIRLEGSRIQVFLDDKQIVDRDELVTSARGHISLQFNQGHVEFRNILMRPLNLQPLKLGANWEEDWELMEKEAGTFRVEAKEEAGLQLVGGLGQLQSKRDYGDFVLQAKYVLAKPEVNSGIFFRCVRDAMLDGYECQVNHAMKDGDPLQPADAGAGAFFRRQAARRVVGDGAEPTYLTLLAAGPHMISWVNGVQVAEFFDSRPPDDNPRKGSRTAAGPVSLQGHDPSTDATYFSLGIQEIK